jgi:hypothetical protein
MKIWTGKFCLRLTLVVLALSACATNEHKKTLSKSDENEVSIKEDQAKIEEMRKDIPEETRKSNDRLAEMLKRWKDQQTPPERLREKFSDEIRKMRVDVEKKHKRAREDFTHDQTDRRKDFQDKQKQARDDFFSTKPKGEKRQAFMDRQGEDRDRFNSDLRDHRDEFEEDIKDQRKAFEDDVADKWSEFRSEYPEYIKEFNEAKEAKEKARETKLNPQSSQPQQKPNGNVNSGGDGWPATDPSD